MKNTALIPFLALACALILPDPASAQEAKPVKIGKIAAAMDKTPDYTVGSVTRKRAVSADWGTVEVELDVKEEFIEELTVKYYISYEDKKMATGEVTHVNLLKGKDKFSSIYLSPGSLLRITEGKPFLPSSIKEVGVQILVKGQVVDAANMNNNARGPWWEQVPGNLTFTGMALDKDHTPFGPVFWDRYAEIKPVPVK